MDVAFDYETVEIQPDGSVKASTEYYRKEFRVSSCAFSHRNEAGDVVSEFVEGEDATRERLQYYVAQGSRFIVHNLQFEYAVTKYRFPDLLPQINFHADTMRLSAMWDNGGDDSDFETIIIEAEEDDQEDEIKRKPLAGFSLVKCAKRILGRDDHKKEAYEWLRANGIKAGQEGANLHLLPRDILERYNYGDTETTLALYEYITDDFRQSSYDWSLDYQLYFSTVRFTVKAKADGVRVQRDPLAKYIDEIRAEIVTLNKTFADKYAAEIKRVERKRLLKRIKRYKRLKGAKKYLKTRPAKDWARNVTFNVGSNDQLAMLFVGELKIEPKFFTAKNSPSFKSSLLGQWGDGGEMLRTRRKRALVLTQAEALYLLSAYDGKVHFDVKVQGTSSGRQAAGKY